jgi:uncharacterized coiled-coil protein SlyX
MAARKTVDVSITDERIARLEEQLAEQTDVLNRLVDLLSEPVAPKQRKIKLTDAQMQALGERRAKAMRQGKMAKRLGITVEEYRAKYGEDAERLPDEAVGDWWRANRQRGLFENE